MTITITNGKGGTGKTTLTTYAAETLLRRGKKVLIIDLDANCCISEVYGKVLQERTSRLLFIGSRAEPYNVKNHQSGGKIDIIPSELNLSMLSNIKDTQIKFQIKSQGYEKDYDFIFIDPPGTWSAHNRNAVFAADVVVVCGKCSKLDHAATLNYMNELQQCCLTSEVFVVCNAYNSLRDPDGNLQKYQQDFGDFILPDAIPMLNTFQRLVGNHEYKVRAQIEKRMENFINAITMEGAKQ